MKSRQVFISTILTGSERSLFWLSICMVSGCATGRPSPLSLIVRRVTGTNYEAFHDSEHPALHDSGIFNTSTPVFSDDEMSTFVAVFDAVARVKGKSAGMFLSCDGCRQGYVMPVKFKTPKVEGENDQREVKTKTQKKQEMTLASLKSLAEGQNKVALHLLELWEDSERIRVMIDYGGNDATERFAQSHPDVTTHWHPT